MSEKQKSNSPTLSQRVASHVVRTTYADLTPSAIAWAENSIIDTLGVALAACSGKTDEPPPAGNEARQRRDGATPRGSARWRWGKRGMKVVLFCGGLGTRLRDYSEEIPKPLVPLGGLGVPLRQLSAGAAR